MNCGLLSFRGGCRFALNLFVDEIVRFTIFMFLKQYPSKRMFLRFSPGFVSDNIK